MGEYNAKYSTPAALQESGADYTHTDAHQAAYDFSVYIHDKMKKLPHYEKFTLQKDIREAVDGILDEIEMYEITKGVSHLYAADRLKKKISPENKACLRSEIHSDKHKRFVLLWKAGGGNRKIDRRPYKSRKRSEKIISYRGDR